MRPSINSLRRLTERFTHSTVEQLYINTTSVLNSDGTDQSQVHVQSEIMRQQLLSVTKKNKAKSVRESVAAAENMTLESVKRNSPTRRGPVKVVDNVLTDGAKSAEEFNVERKM